MLNLIWFDGEWKLDGLDGGMGGEWEAAATGRNGGGWWLPLFLMLGAIFIGGPAKIYLVRLKNCFFK